MKILQICLFLCLTTVAVADTTLTFTGKNNQVSMKMQFAHNMMRATSVDDNSSYMIYDANKSTFSMFMTDKKQYFVIGKKEIKALSDVGSMMEKMMEEQLANVPEAQKEMMRNMMASTMKAQMPKQASKPTYIFTGNSDSINGFSCQVVIKKSGKKESQFCVTKYSNVGMTANEFAVITSFQQTIEKLASQFGEDDSMDFSSLGDFIPVQFSQDKESGTLSDVNHDSLNRTLFSIPSGYSKMEMPF